MIDKRCLFVGDALDRKAYSYVPPTERSVAYGILFSLFGIQIYERTGNVMGILSTENYISAADINL